MADGDIERPLIVGGGIAGLSAGVALARAGLRPIILEADRDEPGGRARRTPDIRFTYEGREHRYPAEHGVHAWWASYVAFKDLIAKVGAADALVKATEQTLLYEDRAGVVHRIPIGRAPQETALPEPLHPARLLTSPEMLRALSPADLASLPRVGALVGEMLAFDARHPGDLQRYAGVSIEALTSGFPPVFEAMLRGLSRSAFFDEPERVSWAAFVDSLQHYVLHNRAHQHFWYARGTVSDTVLTPMIRDLERRGGELRLGARVRVIDRQDSAWRIDLDDGTTLSTRDLVVAVDRGAAVAIARRSKPLANALGDHAHPRGLASAAVRHFWLGRPDPRWGESGVITTRAPGADNYFFVSSFMPELRTWRGSVSECHVYSPALLEGLDDAALGALVGKQLLAGFPSLASHVHTHVVRNPPTHTAWSVDQPFHGPPVDTGDPTLSLAGDWVDGGAQNFFMERACQTGLSAANRVLARRGLPAWAIPSTEPKPAYLAPLRHAARLTRPRPVGPSIDVLRPRRMPIAHLAELPLFAGLDDADHAFLREKLAIHTVRRGEILARDGEEGTAMFALLAGELALKEGRHLVALFDAPRVVGLLSLIDGERRSGTLEAFTDCEVGSLTPADFDELRRRSPRFRRNVLAFLTGELRDVLERTARQELHFDDMFESPHARIVAGPYAADPFDVVFLVMRDDPARVAGLLPPGCRPVPGFGGTYLLMHNFYTRLYSSNPNGRSFAFNETLPFLPCIGPKGKPGLLMPELFLDNYLAIVMGRELYGTPKRFGRTVRGPNRVDVLVGHQMTMRASWQTEHPVGARTFVGRATAAMGPLGVAMAPFGGVTGAIAQQLIVRKAARSLLAMPVFMRKRIPDVQSENELIMRIDELNEVPFGVSHLADFVELGGAQVTWFDKEFFLGGECKAAFRLRMGFEFGKGVKHLDYTAGVGMADAG